jgi:multifunctional methyltransferase subunit TRM112
MDDEALLKAVHHALMDVHVIKGFLVCPESARKFPVTQGIPNMLLNEDEV